MRGKRLAYGLALIGLLVATPVFALRHNHSHVGPCPKCSKPCKLTVSEEMSKKHCWKIEYKDVCVPPVTFSWQYPGKCGKECPPKPTRCGWTRKVRVLVREEFECPHCKYTWSPVDEGCSNPGCSDPGCSEVGCSEVGYSEYDLEPMSPSAPAEVESVIEPPAKPTMEPAAEKAVDNKAAEISPPVRPQETYTAAKYWNQLEGPSKPTGLSTINEWMDQEFQPLAE